MVEEQRLATRDDRTVALYELETQFAMAVRQRELLEKYIQDRLKAHKHFYTVDDAPGRKPSLTKEGAELICLPHALKGHYEWVAGPENPPLDDTPYQITMKCELEKTGIFAGEGIGSASSMITKRTGERVQRQNDPGLRHNATIKMASKSAYIAATLNSTAASEFFTQDLENDQTRKEPDKTQHWCKEHNTQFFKKGKMKSYAHPIGDTGEWCNEEKEEQETKESDAVTKAPEVKEQADSRIDSAEMKNLGDLFSACHRVYGMSQSQVLKECNVSSKDQIADVQEAWWEIVAARSKEEPDNIPY